MVQKLTNFKPREIIINARFLSRPTTGVERYASELIKALDSLIDNGEIDSKQFSFKLMAPRNVKHALNLKHIPLQRVGYLSGHLWEQLELPMYSRGDLLFSPCNTSPVVSLMSSQKTVVVVHDLSPLYFPDAYSLRFRTFYRFIFPIIFIRGDAIVTVSTSERELLLNYYCWSADKLHAVQNGGLPTSYIDEISNVEPSSSSVSRPFVLYVGSLSRRKNFQGVLQAIANLEKDTCVDLVVVGTQGKVFDNREFSVPNSITNKVDFKGQVNDLGELIKLYKSASCLVFPSFHESSGLPPVEAMACGCPVVVSSIPALAERCGDAALYCDPHNPNDIASKIQELISDRGLRESLRQKGFVRAKQFTWQKCARETFAVVEKVLLLQNSVTSSHV